MHNCKAMPFAILVTNAFSRPTTDGIDDVGWAFNGTEAIPQTMKEGVDDASFWHPSPEPLVDGVGRVDGIGRDGVFSTGPVGLLGEFVTGARLGVEGRLVDSPSAPDGVTGLGAGFVVIGLPNTGVLLGFGRTTGCGSWIVGRVEAGADGRLVEGDDFGVSAIGRLIGAVGAGDGLLPSMRSRLVGLPLPIGGRATGAFFVGAFSVVDG